MGIHFRPYPEPRIIRDTQYVIQHRDSNELLIEEIFNRKHREIHYLWISPTPGCTHDLGTNILTACDQGAGPLGHLGKYYNLLSIMMGFSLTTFPLSPSLCPYVCVYFTILNKHKANNVYVYNVQVSNVCIT